ncbi:hypothetical protein COHA_004543 [Chlorella ohadii]|uniref:SBP-type domain-containing protein n=1 Tax=Chlorella ohadii TaxID=2649997 RepID=A0AAD5DRC0_9CHLO|nr:hypothetical protein COHA_004543 [Chlorella ohadii]
MADSLEVDGILQRFCQQCGRFHALEEFEGSKRSCREQLEKQALRRRLARRAAATQSQGGPEQSGSPANCSSGAGRSGENALRLQRDVRAEQLFDGAEEGAAAAAAAPRMQREAQADQLLGAVEGRAAATAIALQPPQPPPPPWLAGAPLVRPATAAEQLAALLLAEVLQQKQPATNLGPQLDGPAPPSQQQLLQQYGSDQSQHSLIALARAMSAGTAAALPSPTAPITPPSAEDLAQTPQQQAAAALLPALAQPSLSPLLQALLALPPPVQQHSQQQLPPPVQQHSQQQLPPPVQQQQQPLPTLPAALPLPSVAPLPLQQLPPPQLPPQLSLHFPAQQPAPGPYAQQLMRQLLSLDQQRLMAQHRAQRSEDELAALVHAVVQFLTALSGAPPAPPP